MSLYREAGGRSTRTMVIAGVVALLIGLGVGYAIGHSSAPEPSATQIVSTLRTQLKPVQSGLTLIPGEYAQAYKKEGVEAEGVQGALDRVEKQLIAAAPTLRALNPRSVERLNIAFFQLKSAVKQKAAPAVVKQKVDAVSAIVETLPGA